MRNVTIDDHAGALAGQAAGDAIAATIARKGRARVVFASAPSQEAMLQRLSQHPGIDWSRVESFHMDEYLGLPMEHPRAFGQWLYDRLPEGARARLNRISSTAEPTQEARRYGALLTERPIDVTCLGVGMNGHVAFNEPGAVRFDDPETTRLVELDELSRRQQVEEGLFPTIDDVPAQAISLTFTALTSAEQLICTVLGSHKALAVAAALEGEVTTGCPASGLQAVEGVHWFLDEGAASQLTQTKRPARQGA